MLSKYGTSLAVIIKFRMACVPFAAQKNKKNIGIARIMALTFFVVMYIKRKQNSQAYRFRVRI